MTVWYWLVTSLIVLVNRAAADETVEGYTGYSAILPCVYSGKISKDFSLFWRFKDSKNVYDISAGKDYLLNQDYQFRNRTTLFPFQYEKGNFSLLLTDLKNFDTGEYTCFYPKERFVRKVILQVKDGPPPATPNSSTETRAEALCRAQVSSSENVEATAASFKRRQCHVLFFFIVALKRAGKTAAL
uniref:Si:dkey-222p3.1 n=1 Tax=Scleropages formosus TaxID=113540 RepID=A0A8C9QY76_SCLFO